MSVIRFKRDERWGFSDVYVDGTYVGMVNGIVYTTKRKKIHFMRKYNGFGISKELLKELWLNGVNRIQITYIAESNGGVYKGLVQDFLASKNVHVFGESDVQHFLSLAEMNQT